MNFKTIFGPKMGPKMSQHGIQKSWEGAMMAKRNDFEKCCFVLFLTIDLEHQASQESPKTAKKPPKMAPGSHQEPFKKWVNFVTPFLPENGPQNGPKSGPKIVKNWSKK